MNAGQEIFYRKGIAPRFWIMSTNREPGKPTTYDLIDSNGQITHHAEASDIIPRNDPNRDGPGNYRDYPSDDQTPSTIRYTRIRQTEAPEPELQKGDQATTAPDLTDDYADKNGNGPTFTILSDPQWEDGAEIWIYKTKDNQTGKREDWEAQCLVKIEPGKPNNQKEGKEGTK